MTETSTRLAKVGRWWSILAIVWLAGVAALLGATWLIQSVSLPWWLIAYLGLTLLASLVCFCLYGWDKWKAMRDGWRVSERTLHVAALVGGWPGAILAQQLFRHKTRKTSFRITFWLILLVHVAIILAGIYVLTRGGDA